MRKLGSLGFGPRSGPGARPPGAPGADPGFLLRRLPGRVREYLGPLSRHSSIWERKAPTVVLLPAPVGSARSHHASQRRARRVCRGDPVPCRSEGRQDLGGRRDHRGLRDMRRGWRQARDLRQTVRGVPGDGQHFLRSGRLRGQAPVSCLLWSRQAAREHRAGRAPAAERSVSRGRSPSTSARASRRAPRCGCPARASVVERAARPAT